MSIAAQSIVKRAATVLKDKTGVRWPADELVEWLIDFERELAVFRPDAYSVVESVAWSSLASSSRSRDMRKAH